MSTMTHPNVQAPQVIDPLPFAGGCRGIWHGQSQDNLPNGFTYKYSGGLATYPQQHSPIAIYAEAVNKTFFVYGGTAGNVHENKANNTLQIHIAVFDHETNMVSQPRVLLDRREAWHHTDAHENPTLVIDDDGYLYVFVNTHGPSNVANRNGASGAASYIFKSLQPYDITGFEQIIGSNPLTADDADTGGTNFSYSNPYWITGEGMLFMHTKYVSWGGRMLGWLTGTPNTDQPSGFAWNERQMLVQVEKGHYQSSALHPDGRTIGTAFNVHPKGETMADSDRDGLDSRTNLYYAQTVGLTGKWTTVDDQPITPGATTRDAMRLMLVRDYAAENKLVYLKSTQFDLAGNPILVYLTSHDYRPGQGGPHTLHTAHWQGGAWVFRDITTCDHNYDYGSLLVDPTEDGGEVWRLVAPLGPGPQPNYTGGEMQVWASTDQGASWNMQHTFGELGPYNHTYARTVLHGHDDFALLWADGDPSQVSPSSLYFTNRTATKVFRMPYVFDADWTLPELVYEA